MLWVKFWELSLYFHFSQREYKQTIKQNCGILCTGAGNQLHYGFVLFVQCYWRKFRGWAFTFTFLKENKQTIKQNCGILLRGAAATRSFFQTKQARTPTAQKNKIFPTNSNNFFLRNSLHETKVFPTTFSQKILYNKPGILSQWHCSEKNVLHSNCGGRIINFINRLPIHGFYTFLINPSINQSTHFYQSINLNVQHKEWFIGSNIWYKLTLRNLSRGR